MNILHLFSGNLFTGATEHALELAGAQQEAGHQVWLASDFAGFPTTLPYLTLPVHDRRWGQKRKARKKLRALLQEQEIQIIHAHSKAASALASSVISGREPALVSTVHGRQHLHFKSKRTDPYGEKIIAVSAALKTHLVTELRKKASKITVVPNGLVFPDHPPVALPAEPVISWIGRLNGPKGERAATLFKEVFPQLLHRFPALKIIIAGDAAGPMPQNGDSHLAALQAHFGERVQYLGFVEDVVPAIEASSLVIGAGRVALRALGLGRNVLALGEAACEGLVTPENIETLAPGNFGDTGEKEPHITQKAASELHHFLTAFVPAAHPPAVLAGWVRVHFNLATVSRQIMAVYCEARMRRLQPKWLPVLEYKEIADPDTNEPGSGSVPKTHFQKQLHWMEKRGLVPVTFEDYEAVASGGRRGLQWPRKPVILTFNKSCESVWQNAFPLMQEKGWRGVLYVPGTYKISTTNQDSGEAGNQFINEAQIAGMLRAGWQCGIHATMHLNPDSRPAAIQKEIRESKEHLENMFNRPVKTFAYSSGSCNEAVVQAVQEAGFHTAVATGAGAFRLEDNPFCIFRVAVLPEETAFSFWKKTTSWYHDYSYRKRRKQGAFYSAFLTT